MCSFCTAVFYIKRAVYTIAITTNWYYCRKPRINRLFLVMASANQTGKLEASHPFFSDNAKFCLRLSSYIYA